ncbi:hypothetical protein HII36_53565 [Nonomuraea sp. NN258]|uniref:hypothetical protein n=1 Tax=Nonomuraea antri TaxID=2730852 RepID=UPI0015694DA1|nr:hypothetical protein [Nonomuraea antri]NRQ40582.1 hypothetical protein [Nonomuraea antri]
MTGPWRTPRGPIAFTGAMGLVLLSLLLAGSLFGAYGEDSAGRAPLTSGETWSAGVWDMRMPSLPPQGLSMREHHVLSLWPRLRDDRRAAVAHLALLPTPGRDAHELRDPQQFAHRTAGSRSPPPS